MTSPMTEARLSEIATKINSSTSLEQDCADAINEVRRLRECIANLDIIHEPNCEKENSKRWDVDATYNCVCVWKRQALGGE